MAIWIKTEAVLTAAEEINRLNGQIREDLDDVGMTLQSLQNSWKGAAADKSSRAYQHIKTHILDFRFSVINNLVSLLKHQVGAGYEATETAVSKAADAFK